MGEPKVLITSTKMDKFRGFIFCSIMLLSAFFGSIYVLMPLLPLIYITPRIYRRLIDRLVGFWLVMPLCLMEYMFGLKLTVTGDIIENNKPGLIIMNHRTRLDWLYFWSALFRINPWLLTSEKISLKGILKFIPGAGWAMAANTYMFLDRSFENDKERIKQLLEYYARVGDNYQLLLYPEGTDKCPKATGRSKTFAEKKNLIHYDYVLHPRTTGFVYMVQKMRQENYIDYVYDVTVAFNDSIVQSEADLIKLGLTSKDVHFDIKKISIKDLPESDEELGKWLRNHWETKEEKLRKFYSTVEKDRKLETSVNAKHFEMTTNSRFIQISICGVWLILTFVWMYFFKLSDHKFIIAFGTIGFFICMQKFFGGFEMLVSKIGLSEWNSRISNDHHIKNGHIGNDNDSKSD